MGDWLEKRISTEARVLSREQLMQRCLAGQMRWNQAAVVMGLSTRQMRRLRDRYEKLGAAGLRDGRAGNRRKKRVPASMTKRLQKLKRTKYVDYSVKHFYDVMRDTQGLTASYEWTLRMLQKAALVERSPRRGTYRRRRERQPMVGMRVHTDGSTHAWLGAERAECDLVIMLDDADGRLLAARFVPQESVMSTFALLEEVLCKHGRFGELYHDRGSMYCRTGDASVGPDPEQAGQVSRALEALGIRQRWAYSPQARGRCERAFGTIQGRLCAELATGRITDYEAANTYLQAVFIKDFNRRFTVEPKEPESAFVPVGLRKQDRELLLSAQYERQVQNDYTVRFRSHVLQLPKPRDSRLFAGQSVIVHQLLDGRLAISHKGVLLAHFYATEPWYRASSRGHHQPTPAPTPATKTLHEALGKDPDDPIIRRNDLFSPAW
jgi:Winged helix-turn helix